MFSDLYKILSTVCPPSILNHSPSCLLCCRHSGLLVFPQKVPKPFSPSRLCSFCSFCSFSRYLLGSTLRFFTSLLKCYLLASPLPSLFNNTIILSLHLSSHVIPTVWWIFVECMNLRLNGRGAAKFPECFPWQFFEKFTSFPSQFNLHAQGSNYSFSFRMFGDGSIIAKHGKRLHWETEILIKV